MLGLKGNIVIGAVIFLALLLAACASPALTPAPAPDPESENKAVIQDRKGRLWDVTHARDVYAMNPDYFNYGLGIGVIPSVDEPVVLEEGDPGYPEPDSAIRVFGVDRNGEQRAYSISDLVQHEVFNDVFPGEPDQYLAIAY